MSSPSAYPKVVERIGGLGHRSASAVWLGVWNGSQAMFVWYGMDPSTNEEEEYTIKVSVF